MTGIYNKKMFKKCWLLPKMNFKKLRELTIVDAFKLIAPVDIPLNVFKGIDFTRLKIKKKENKNLHSTPCYLN